MGSSIILTIANKLQHAEVKYIGRFLVIVAFLSTGITVEAQTPGLPSSAMIERNAGETTVRAVRLIQPLQLDGQLTESIYTDVPSISGLIQIEPEEGVAPSERTEVWIMFDDNNVYFSARCWEESPEGRTIANEMRRDSFNIPQNEHIGFTFDTFYDRRNAYMWIINPIGGRMDGQITDESVYNPDWNPVYELRTGRFEQGWTLEVVIPFKSLRYRPGREQVWGFMLRRQVGWRNETNFLTRIPQVMAQSGLSQQSMSAKLVGIEVPWHEVNLEIKPYAIADLTTQRQTSPAVENNFDQNFNHNFGLDAKYGVTQNLTADFTYNTDFAQVEADEQQINLTRFSLFFPEKREFFLENQGNFSFGVSSGPASASSNTGDTPTLFYSRRIGLSQGQVVPLQAGGRLTGRVGRYSIGLLNIQSSNDLAFNAPKTNFSVLRIKRDILRRSAIGFIATHRSINESQSGTNDVFGADATFTFLELLNINGYWARTWTDGLSGDDTSYRGQLDYNGDRYGIQTEHLFIGNNFNPEIGFIRRRDIRKSYAQFRFSPRPKNNKTLRKYSWTTSIDYIEDGRGTLDTRTAESEFALEFQNGDRLYASGNNNYEFLPIPFQIGPNVSVSAGAYNYSGFKVGFALGQVRKFNGNASVEYGTFYGGSRTVVSFSQGRLELTPQFSLEPSFSFNRIELPAGTFTTTLASSRITYTMSPWMFVSALVQYNSVDHSFSSNVRFRWEYQPGSELFIVYNEQRDTRLLDPSGTISRFPWLSNRTLVVKINRLIRF